MFTIEAARAGVDERDLGEVELNRLADLVVWEKTRPTWLPPISSNCDRVSCWSLAKNSGVSE